MFFYFLSFSWVGHFVSVKIELESFFRAEPLKVFSSNEWMPVCLFVPKSRTIPLYMLKLTCNPRLRSFSSIMVHADDAAVVSFSA